jgi:hypothetical protein
VKFLDPLIVRHLDEGRWHVEKELRCLPDSGRAIYVPAGFETDLASIPRPLWAILPPAGRWARASVLHDWLYHNRLYSRRLCDALFLEGMKADGVDKSTRNIIHSAVRAFGAGAYKS